MRFDNIRKQIADYEAATIAKFDTELDNKTAGQILDSWYLRGLCTNKAFETVKAMDSEAIPDVKTMDKIKAKHARREKKNTADRLHKIDLAEMACGADEFTVCVEWVRSSTWGYNPHATVYGFNAVTKDYASGCGYDKESAAIAGAFNTNPEIMRILYNHAENGGSFPYGVHTFAGVPAFDGGCGVSVFYHIFDACGYEFKQVVSGDRCRAYKITKK